MKKTIGIMLALFVVKSGISQQLTFPDAPAVISHVSGYWVWVETCGGLAFSCTPATPTNTAAMEIASVPGTPDSISYTIYTNGAISHAGYAQVRADSGMYGPGWIFVGIQSFITDEFLVAQQDTISMIDYCFDCYSHGYARSPVGIKEIKDGKTPMEIYPNPATDLISVRITGTTAKVCEVYDLLGKKVIAAKNSSSIDISMLNKGIYLVCAEDENGRHTQRFVKE